jgi:thiamine kinase-like enzyme
MNFWQYVQPISGESDPVSVGETLQLCHRILMDFPGTLPELAILTESLALLETLEEKGLFPASTITLLRDRLTSSTQALRGFPFQPLHGDAHPGNLMLTSSGLLWADWEDAFSGPVEWDLASIIWNAKILENDQQTADAILTAYLRAGGRIDPHALGHCLIARAAVMSAWYPILYPDPSPERKGKLQARLDWLASDLPESIMT